MTKAGSRSQLRPWPASVLIIERRGNCRSARLQRGEDTVQCHRGPLISGVATDNLVLLAHPVTEGKLPIR
jgi:hypothetical protein